MVVFIRGETLSAHSAHPRKISGWIVFICENIAVNKRAYRKETIIIIEIVLRGFFFFSFSNFAFGFHSFHLKKVKIIQYDFGTGTRKKI